MNNISIRIRENNNAYANGCFIWLFHRYFPGQTEATWKQPLKMVVSSYEPIYVKFSYSYI